MQQPCHPQPRTSVVSRLLIWGAGALILLIGALSSNIAWANNICPGNGTIPVAPITLFLKSDGSPSTYQIGVCETPTAPVNISVTAAPTGRVNIAPANFSLTTTVSRTVAVAVQPNHPKTDPFKVILTHSAQSADPRYNVGSTNVPTVTVNYLPPKAVIDTAITLAGEAVTVNVKANDLDRLGQGITPTVITPPAHGNATVLANQSIRYTPAANYTGWDQFTYRITDAIGNSSDAQVIIWVRTANQTAAQILLLTLGEAGELIIQTLVGPVTVQVPADLLKGNIAPGAQIALLFTQILVPTGDLAKPTGGAAYTGLAYQLEMIVAGSPAVVELKEPLIFTIGPSAALRPSGATYFFAYWDGAKWTSEGITMLGQSTGSATLSFSTTHLGEYVLFGIQHIFMPVVRKS
jgi:hypothetical protein